MQPPQRLQEEVAMWKRIVATLVAGIMGLCLIAGELEGVKMPDEVTIGENTLTLNGMGLRIKKVVFVKVKVYVAGLYLTTPSKDPAAILAADEPRRIVMHFLYKNVAKKKLVAAWEEGFEDNAKNVDALRGSLARFNSYWGDMKTGDEAVMTYIPGTGTKVEIKGKEMGVIKGKEFADALLAVWLGPEPPNKEIKKGMLGK
jgi:hypothetical protein